MPMVRHHIFQQMTLALAHQQNGNMELALAYWESVLRALPENLPIHNAILAECARLLKGAESERLQQKLAALTAAYQQEIPEEAQLTFQQAYRAMIQQCSGNHALAFAYWKNVAAELTSEARIITLGVQDFCWSADQYLQAGNIKNCLALYEQLLATFPEFLEGYINFSLIKYKAGPFAQALPLLAHVPPPYREEFIIVRYRDLFARLAEVAGQFELIPYAAVEEMVNALRIENTFYPAIGEEYFAELIAELINREKRFFEKRRKALEERALAKTSKRLAQEGFALGQRVTLAKHAKSEEIHNFLYDNDIRIAEALLINPNLTREDVLVMAQTSHVSEVLKLIAENRKWGSPHSVALALVCNPQMLPQDAARLLERLSLNDLAAVFYKRTLPAEVRIRAKAKLQEVFNQLSSDDKVAVIEVSCGDILKLVEAVALELPSFCAALISKFAAQPEIIVNLCRWKLTPATTLALIGTDARFCAQLPIKFALLSNPRTPGEIAAALVQSLEKKDVRYFLANKHIPTSVKHCIAAMFPETSA